MRLQMYDPEIVVYRNPDTFSYPLQLHYTRTTQQFFCVLARTGHNIHAHEVDKVLRP